MRLDELALAYLTRANRVFLKTTGNAEQQAPLIACNQAYLAARDAVQALINQGPMPTGQIWRLNGNMATSAWTPKQEKP